MRAALRSVAEWTLLTLLGVALGIGTAEAERAGLVSEQTVFICFGVLMAGAAAFAVWSARAFYLMPWDDWDDDPDPPADS